MRKSTRLLFPPLFRLIQSLAVYLRPGKNMSASGTSTVLPTEAPMTASPPLRIFGATSYALLSSCSICMNLILMYIFIKVCYSLLVRSLKGRRPRVGSSTLQAYRLLCDRVADDHLRSLHASDAVDSGGTDHLRRSAGKRVSAVWGHAIGLVGSITAVSNTQSNSWQTFFSCEPSKGPLN